MDEAERKRQRKNAKSREHYQENKERVCARTGAYQKANPSKVRKYITSWRDRNRERFRLMAYRYQGFPEPTRPRPELCESCGGPPKRHVLNLDHCHETGIFRGWLCWTCNSAIGRLGDNIAGLQKAMDYLKRAEHKVKAA